MTSAEHRLRESDARKSAILDAAFDCIITMDADGNVVEVNPAAERTFGYAASEMVGRELAELIIPERLREAHRRGVERYAATGESSMVGHPVELPAMRADGSEFPVEIAITRPNLPGPPQFTGFLRDVTERHRNEEALRSLAAEQAALRRVATTVASEADPERVFAVVTEEVGRLLGAHTANLVRLEPDGTAVVVGAWRAGEARDATDGPAVTAPIVLAGRQWGAVTASTTEDAPFPDGCGQRIADFAELVAIALANAQAREELAASRARIVEAGDAERRRLERNLHDGAQQRLVALSLTLRLAEARLSKGDEAGVELVTSANAELAEALSELRELARGIHPAILTDRGLMPALEMLAARASLPVDISSTIEDELPGPVEAAAYYMVAEALTNASRHARASRVRVHVGCADGAAVVEVSDDGCGGADTAAGSGLRGLADRVEALDGTLQLESPPGGGTTLRARMPTRSAATARSGSPSTSRT